MPTYRLDFAYDGTDFHGYARQDDQRTVQGELEAALKTWFSADVSTSVAGRTDTGVHALGQVVSFERDISFDTEKLKRGLVGMLGSEISILEIVEAQPDFHARFSARWRQYRYLIDQSSAPNPLTRSYVWQVGRELDVESMATTSRAFVGKHDFGSFCRSVEGRSNVRDLTRFDLTDDGRLVEMTIRANAFCHQMVRSIVGYLYDVGRAYSDGSLVAEVLASTNRGLVVTVAPPHGLTLMEVGYE